MIATHIHSIKNNIPQQHSTFGVGMGVVKEAVLSVLLLMCIYDTL